ncbi:hypothetical protein, partial [Halorubrum sp. SP9]
MSTQTAEHDAETLESAVNTVRTLPWWNGMATEPVSVERENCYIHVVRKCGSLDRPEILLFRVIPKNGMDPNYGALAEEIPEAAGIYGDLRAEFVGDTTKTCV